MSHIMRRLLSFFRRGRLDDELAEEIRVHLELRQQALMDGGMPPADAEREARRQFGNVIAVREQSRDHWGSALLTALGQDVRFGLRMITRAPALSAIVVLIITLGAGINSAIGIRMALGAERRRAVTFVIRRVLKPVVIGLLAGLGIGAPAARALGAVLYGVSPLDPLAFMGAVGFLAIAAVVAAWLPARRAATVDPLLALRSE